MITKQSVESGYTKKVQEILGKEPGLSVKDIATKLKMNRQFMAGFLIALEEKGDLFHRQVGPARIYFLTSGINGN